MKVTAIAVTSLDGKLTKGDDPEVKNWSSSEDWEHFVKVRSGVDLIIMGRKTYEASKKHIDYGVKAMRVVLTSSPDEYRGEEIDGKLLFTDDNPQVVIDAYSKKGYKKALVAGGGSVFQAFFDSKMIDDFYLSLEPRLFGEGAPLISGELDVNMTLRNIEKLNDKGTLLLHYDVDK